MRRHAVLSPTPIRHYHSTYHLHCTQKADTRARLLRGLILLHCCFSVHRMTDYHMVASGPDKWRHWGGLHRNTATIWRVARSWKGILEDLNDRMRSCSYWTWGRCSDLGRRNLYSDQAVTNRSRMSETHFWIHLKHGVGIDECSNWYQLFPETHYPNSLPPRTTWKCVQHIKNKEFPWVYATAKIYKRMLVSLLKPTTNTFGAATGAGGKAREACDCDAWVTTILAMVIRNVWPNP